MYVCIYLYIHICICTYMYVYILDIKLNELTPSRKKTQFCNYYIIFLLSSKLLIHYSVAICDSVGITLFCDQGRKSESLEERRNIM